MSKKVPAVFRLCMQAALIAAVPVCAQAMPVDENMPPHVLTLPPNYGQPSQPQNPAPPQFNPPASPTSSGGNPVVYSAQEYPTAQGRYLALPQRYSAPAASAAPPSRPVPAALAVMPPVPPVAQSQLQPLPRAAAPVQIASVSSVPAASPTASVSQPASVTQPARTSFDQLPSFPYDPNLDPRNVPKPPVHELPDSPDHIGLGTTTGGEVGLQISSYRYQEFSNGQELMRLTGPNFGVTLEGNEVYSSGWFIGGGVRIAYGLHDYTGGDINTFTQTITPSTHNGIGDLLIESQFLAGHDFIIHGAFWHAFDLGLSPYAGLGFRYLYDDSQGADSNGVPGYERYSHYFYLPVGITPRVRLAETLRLSMNMEFDELLYGWQVSSLGEAIPGAGDVTNTQSSGYGLRGSVMFEWPKWSFGPFFNFWDIAQSNEACDTNNVACGYEPHNQTIEYGLQGKYRF